MRNCVNIDVMKILMEHVQPIVILQASARYIFPMKSKEMEEVTNAMLKVILIHCFVWRIPRENVC